MRTKMTLAEIDDTNRVVGMVLRQAAACSTAAETRDLAMNFCHGGAAALVATAGHEFTLDFLRKLTAAIEDEAESERLQAMQ
ncbi:MAG: hypothetical protein ACR652_10200 [Methylocystis sp.]|uniref:hypothetical protein n=1 Tax=Methylocystis sp. TaxID=1911079 RepID=UPI003DA6628D